MLGWLFAVILGLFVWAVYDGAISRSLPEKQVDKIEARGKIVSPTWVERKHLRHMPPSTQHVFVISLTNNSDYILRELGVWVRFYDADNSKLGDDSGLCLSEGQRDYRILVGATLKQACVLPLSQQASAVREGMLYDHLQWQFTVVAGHKPPLRLVKGVSDWWSSMRASVHSWFETVNSWFETVNE